MKPLKEETAVARKLLRPVLLGGIVGAIVILLVLAGLAWLITQKDVPQSAYTPLAVVAAAVGALAGGIVAARSAGEKGWLAGLCTGILLFLAILIAGGFAMLRDLQASYLLVKIAVMLGCGTVGGMIGVGKRKKRH